MRGDDSAPLGSIGDYELLEEIARGGMGVVYRARQRSLGRIVAVKTILPAARAGKEFTRRFRAEASIAATLHHPNIVAIHEVGVQDGHHYFSMDYVAGQTLGQLVGQHPLADLRTARYVALIAEATHYAHEQGVLHRDLKPSNVLIDNATDEPRVTDFGLAKRLDLESSLTLTGQLLGSPNFMPPEQASVSREKLGPWSDVYSLGGILFYLLTARAPFQADSLEHLLEQVLHAEPVPPRLLNGSVSKDLETITLKCLEKEPSRRYQSAQEVADELRRFLRQEPIRARPINPSAKLWRWCRRKPMVASLIILLHVVGAAGLGGILWQWQRAERHATLERQERQLGQRQLYLAKMKLVQHRWEQNQVSRVRELLEETATAPERGFEWFYWMRQLHREIRALRGHMGTILAVAYFRDGRVISGSGDNTARVWDPSTGKTLMRLEEHTGPIRSVAVSSDSRFILTGSWDGTAKLWDAPSGRRVRTFTMHRGAAVFSAAFSPDGRRIVTASQDQAVKIWSVEDVEKPLVTFAGHSNFVWAAEFSPDGKHVVSGGWDGNARLWDAETGDELWTLKDHRGAVLSVAFSPEGHYVVTGSQDHTAKLWDLRSRTLVDTLRGHTAPVFSVSYSLDGTRVLTGSDDQTARLWDPARGEQLSVFRGHGSRIGSAALSPDGKHIVTGGGAVTPSADGIFYDHTREDDPTIKVWDAADPREVLTLRDHAAAVVCLDISRDGRLMVSGSFDSTAIIRDIATGKKLHRLSGHRDRIRGVAFFPDGKRIITGSFDRTARIWDVDSGTELNPPLVGHTAEIFSVAVSPDSRWVATGSWDRTVRVWETATGRVKVFTNHNDLVYPVTFSPDGGAILSADGSGVGNVWEPDSGKVLVEFRDIARIWCAAFSGNGQIVSGNHASTAKLWDATSGREQLTFKGHTAQVHAAAFFPDSSRVVTGSADQTAKLWDITTGEEVLSLNGHAGNVFCAAVSRDGQRIATGSADGTVRLWEAASRKQVEEWQEEEARLRRKQKR